jgi:hypothetical protein
LKRKVFAKTVFLTSLIILLKKQKRLLIIPKIIVMLVVRSLGRWTHQDGLILEALTLIIGAVKNL